MKTLREAAQQALEALDDAAWHMHPAYAQNAAITALRQALKTEQRESAHESELMMNDHNYRAKFTGAQAQQPLTDEQIESIWRENSGGYWHDRSMGEGDFYGAVRYVERAHGIGQEGGAA